MARPVSVPETTRSGRPAEAPRRLADVAPLTPERWSDFVDLFLRPTPRGGKGIGDANGCWCMWWRGRSSADVNRARIEEIVRSGAVPGLLAYERGRAIGWISLDQRRRYEGLLRSRRYKPCDDDGDVWAITCLYVHPAERRRGVADTLVSRAIARAFEEGASAIEAYPMSPGKRKDYMGSSSRYGRFGFVAVRDAGVRTVVRLARPPAAANGRDGRP